MGEQIQTSPGGTGGGYRVRTYRVGPSETAVVLFLCARLAGVMVHYQKGKGAALCVKECPAALHTVKPQWRGYAPVLLYHPGDGANWFPTLLEVTEHAELDLRTGFQRGEVWSVTKHGDEKHSPVRCRNTGQRLTGAWIPPAFDARPLIRTIYHVHSEFKVDVPNPLPAHTIVQAIMGHALEGMGADQAAAEVTPEQRREALEKLRARLRPGKEGEE